MNGRFSSTAACIARTSASPTPMPSEPPRKSKGCTATITGMPSSVPRAAVSASWRCVLVRARFHLVGISLLAAEFQRIGGDRRHRQLFKLSAVEDRRRNAPAGPMRM